MASRSSTSTGGACSGAWKRSRRVTRRARCSHWFDFPTKIVNAPAHAHGPVFSWPVIIFSATIFILSPFLPVLYRHFADQYPKRRHTINYIQILFTNETFIEEFSLPSILNVENIKNSKTGVHSPFLFQDRLK